MTTMTAADLPSTVPAERAWLTPLELGLLAAMWGASFMFQRVAAPEFGTLPLVEIRLGLGALVLLPFLWVARQSFPEPDHVRSQQPTTYFTSRHRFCIIIPGFREGITLGTAHALDIAVQFQYVLAACKAV